MTMSERTMRRAAAAAIALCLVAGQGAAQQDVTRAIVGLLARQGYQQITISRTFLGRNRIVARGGGVKREIVVNPNTGEILRDYAAPDDGAQAGGGLLPGLFGTAPLSQGAGEDDGDDGGQGRGRGGDDNSGRGGGDDGDGDRGGGNSGPGGGGDHDGGVDGGDDGGGGNSGHGGGDNGGGGDGGGGDHDGGGGGGDDD